MGDRQKAGRGRELQCGHDELVVENTESEALAACGWELQCGHDELVVENSFPGPLLPTALWKLQCGHDELVVENFDCGAGRIDNRNASMRPRRISRGELDSSGKKWSPPALLQCGHDE